jgi:predicted nucleotidyltransferase
MLLDLVGADVRLVVIGGVSATLHGSAYITKDLDLCYDTEPDNIERLANRLRDWHAYLYGVEPGLPWTMDARAIRTNPVLTLITDHGRIDVMDQVAGIGDYAACVRASEEMPFEGTRVRTLSLDALIIAKRAAARTKDQARVLELEALYAKVHGHEPPRVREPTRRPRRSRRPHRA